MKGKAVFVPLMLTILMYGWGAFGVSAQETSASDTEGLNLINEEIVEKKAHIDQINRKIDEYKELIEKKQEEAATLSGEVDLLENRIAKSELEIEATEESIAAVHAELALIEERMNELEAKQEEQRQILKAILQEINAADGQTMIEMLFGNASFSELFDQLQYLEIVSADLHETLEAAKRAEEALAKLRTEQEGKLASLEELDAQLKRTLALLDEERSAKEVLVAQTLASEAQFAVLLYELREEQQFINNQIALLQADLERRLYENDIVGDSSVLSWPVEPVKGISATFHDPSYPYRHLFEHSGLDIPVDVGTPVGSAAPGYVAWTREGRLYGYYVMIVHTDGVATLYAHLSKILVEPDQFVTRGQAIGLSGGRPGLAGAGLSTGPHLHFEVRKDGIPTNPLDYLLSE
jgi:murein DD-endopeptidase MepM/ murein hydrolase activator NlpD